MLNTKKLLYILPDVSYVVELLPAKKEATFAVQSFRQINGEFIDDNEFIADNVEKLILKLDSENYQLILPDFLFTNTIVEVTETSEHKVSEYLKDYLLPKLDLQKETHQIKTHVLTQYGGKSRVQLSALENTILEPLRSPAAKNKVGITGISPLSWTIKSLISLEPSISIVQIGAKLYLALHYIGVDQCMSYDLEDFEAVGETIKTLKGAEPSIQNVYLLSNGLVEKNIQKILSKTLPIQQLANSDEEIDNMPVYIKQIIEAGMRTLEIKDFPVPKFNLGKISPTPIKEKETDKEPMPKDDSSSVTNVTEVTTHKPKIETVEIFEDEETDDKDDQVISKSATLPKPTTVGVTTHTTHHTHVEEKETETEKEKEEHESEVEETVSHKETSVTTETKSTHEDKHTESADHAPAHEHSHDQKRPPLKLFNQKSGYGQMLKMVFIAVSVFFATVAIGVGLGLGVLSLSNKSTEIKDSPLASENPTPTAEPEASAQPSPSPEVVIDKTTYSILVVNATTVAGQAGKVKKLLQEDDFTEIATGNAKDDYDAGFYLLLDPKADLDQESVLDTMSTATGLELQIDENLKKSVEDSQGKYDAVIVLADKLTSSEANTTAGE